MLTSSRYGYNGNTEKIDDRAGNNTHDSAELKPVLMFLILSGKTRVEIIQIVRKSFALGHDAAERLVAKALDGKPISYDVDVVDPFAAPNREPK